MIEDDAGQPPALGRMRREPSPAMVRQLRYRDGECRFPGCGARRFAQGHHIVWWERGGTTDLSNLVLVCTFHHKLVHEHGWAIRRDPGGEVRWFRPDGGRYRAGPDPPREALRGVRKARHGPDGRGPFVRCPPGHRGVQLPKRRQGEAGG